MSVINNPARLQDSTLLNQLSDHEQVVFCNDKHTGLQAIIAIHDTTLGPALGGCRMHPYETVDAALTDALRLSKGMTYKCAAADVDFGGGKAVIIGDPKTDKSPALFRAFGQFVETLGGRFITGTDMGTTMDDFVHALKETNHIVGVPEAYGGGGDSSIPTAKGVLYGLMATNQMLFGRDDLQQSTYAVQGLGKVGFKVAKGLLEAGAKLYVSDIADEKVGQLEAEAAGLPGSLEKVPDSAICSQSADIFVPCALGGVLNDHTIRELRVKAVAGSANNQLASDQHGSKLAERGILYAPDYIINSGGLIQVADELYGANEQRVLLKTKDIYHIMLDVYRQAESDQIPTAEAADRICRQVLIDRKRLNSFYTRSVRPKWNLARRTQ
ncbi:Phenylalanine dehydrogenase [Lentibacillus sp. JNUCC-1]|uniref:Leu/Phe/Val dehydrogenase n=1 Tax=Lentibacillus sp. JNUCC-1 TaxID=2654513 RepID=UPI0012E838F3|nr:Glu/Leu/Phe/Val dehydrogenase [Lentibacillus sp. JNUCC-1]MUV37538.1 Phenylalanine dehydrogenase [Lentibacillus sp. JNUCC-1]